MMIFLFFKTSNGLLEAEISSDHDCNFLGGGLSLERADDDDDDETIRIRIRNN